MLVIRIGHGGGANRMLKVEWLVVTILQQRPDFFVLAVA
jgi:hypothetical protein